MVRFRRGVVKWALIVVPRTRFECFKNCIYNCQLYLLGCNFTWVLYLRSTGRSFGPIFFKLGTNIPFCNPNRIQSKFRFFSKEFNNIYPCLRGLGVCPKGWFLFLLDFAKTIHDFLVHLIYHIYDANLLKLGVI